MQIQKISTETCIKSFVLVDVVVIMLMMTLLLLLALLFHSTHTGILLSVVMYWEKLKFFALRRSMHTSVLRRVSASTAAAVSCGRSRTEVKKKKTGDRQ
jgi:hypothetical protein